MLPTIIGIHTGVNDEIGYVALWFASIAVLYCIYVHGVCQGRDGLHVDISCTGWLRDTLKTVDYGSCLMLLPSKYLVFLEAQDVSQRPRYINGSSD